MFLFGILYCLKPPSVLLRMIQKKIKALFIQYSFQVVSLFLLFLSVMMINIPLHVMSLTEHFLSKDYFHISLSMQETISSLLSKTLITDVGRMLLGSSACLLLPSTLGYVGAVRESRLLLVLVRLCGVYHMYSCIIMDSTSHPS